MIYISPTRLQRWFECGCPKQWDLERSWVPKQKNEMAERGTLVHRMLAGEVDVKKVTDKPALMFHQKLLDLRNLLQLRVEHMELYQTFPLTQVEDVMWIRVIDVIGYVGTERLISDYKTTGGTWKQIAEGVTPQAMAAQSPGYLIPPDSGEWPTRMLYLVANYRGPAQVYTYDRNEEDDANFFEAVTMLRDAVKGNRFPKIRGRNCIECPVRHACYELPGWRKQYTKKKPHGSSKS